MYSCSFHTWLKKTLPLLSFCSVLLLVSPVVPANTLVIAHQDVKQEVVSTQALGRVYAMQLRRWPTGEAIQVYRLPSNHETHQNFAISQLKMQPHQLDRLWNRYVFTGTGSTPVIVRDEKEMLERVRATPGAIGYVAKSDNLSGVKVLKVVQ